jgi:NADH dehydrogenase (ubiquinone) 1 alpha/beta subcomplex 1
LRRFFSLSGSLLGCQVNADAVVPTAHFVKDLGLDSLDVVELGLALEEEFAIEIPDADAEGLLSVPDAVNYLSTHPQSR